MGSKQKQEKMRRNRRRQKEVQRMKRETKSKNEIFSCRKCVAFRRCTGSDRNYPCSVYLDAKKKKP